MADLTARKQDKQAQNALPPDEADDDVEPPRLRFLRRLVIALTMTLIVGLTIIVVALVVKFSRPAPAPQARFTPEVSARFTLAPGAELVESSLGERYLLLRLRERESGAEWLELLRLSDGAKAMRIDIVKGDAPDSP